MNILLLFLSDAVSFDFGHRFFISKLLKKCEQSVYTGKFGLPLPWFPIYAECPHWYVRTFAIFRKTITICGRLNLSLIKQMLIHVMSAQRFAFSPYFTSRRID